jgi:hypothetical protein
MSTMPCAVKRAAPPDLIALTLPCLLFRKYPMGWNRIEQRVFVIVPNLRKVAHAA